MISQLLLVVYVVFALIIPGTLIEIIRLKRDIGFFDELINELSHSNNYNYIDIIKAIA